MSDLTEPISGDEYVRVVLVGRQRAWLDAHPRTAQKGLPPLLEWFIQAGDEKYVQLPEPEPAPTRQPRPRHYRSAASLRAERDTLAKRMTQIAAAGDVGDRAAANLSPHSRSRAARTAGRRRFAQMDHALERYTAMSRHLENLNQRIAAAERREAQTATDQ